MVKLSAKQVERFMKGLEKKNGHHIKKRSVKISGVVYQSCHVFHYIKTGRILRDSERLLKTCRVRNCISCRKKLTHSQIARITGRLKGKKKR